MRLDFGTAARGGSCGSRRLWLVCGDGRPRLATAAMSGCTAAVDLSRQKCTHHPPSHTSARATPPHINTRTTPRPPPVSLARPVQFPCSDTSPRVTGATSIRLNRYSGPPNPLFNHGILRPSSGGRYLEHADGTPFYWLGDTHWSGFSTAERWNETNNASVDPGVRTYTYEHS